MVLFSASGYREQRFGTEGSLRECDILSFSVAHCDTVPSFPSMAQQHQKKKHGAFVAWVPILLSVVSVITASIW